MVGFLSHRLLSEEKFSPKHVSLSLSLSLSLTPWLTSQQILFVISRPDVFKSPNSDTYVIFGEAKIEDLSSQLQTQAAEQFKAPDLSQILSKAESSSAAGLTTQEDDEVDETGVDEKDIELVMTQASVSRSKAVKALKAADGDIVAAIMELTT